LDRIGASSTNRCAVGVVGVCDWRRLGGLGRSSGCCRSLGLGHLGRFYGFVGWRPAIRAPEGARVKGQVENKLHALICGGSITLATAQRAIATNWWIAYQTYVGAVPAASTYKAPVVAQPEPAPVAPGGGTALCNDGTYSYAAHHQGACSGHGGVKVFYK
jgi:Protein of unknown function (DUF3761)